MIRVGLLLYLMLVIAAGPAVCCCLAVQVGDIVAKEASGPEGCCPKHVPTNKETPSKCPNPPCLCKENCYDPNVGRLADSAEILKNLRHQESIEGIAAFAVAASVDVRADAAVPPNLAFTFLESIDILRAIHGLRC